MPEPTTATPRARAIVAAARQILECEGSEGLTMRRLGEAVGIRAPSLYKHFPDKAAVEIALIDDGFAEMAEAVEAALAERGESLATLMAAYRTFARAHPHLYRLLTTRPLPRERLRPGVEARAAAPMLQVTGDPDLARAAWAFAHGMMILELDGRFPPDADLDAAWAAGLAAFAVAQPRCRALVGTNVPGASTRPLPADPSSSDWRARPPPSPTAGQRTPPQRTTQPHLSDHRQRIRKGPHD